MVFGVELGVGAGAGAEVAEGAGAAGAGAALEPLFGCPWLPELPGTGAFPESTGTGEVESVATGAGVDVSVGETTGVPLSTTVWPAGTRLESA